jgi:hypothetical protein
MKTIYVVGYDGSGYEYGSSVAVLGPDSPGFSTDDRLANYTKAFTSKQAALDYLDKLDKTETGFCCTTIGVVELEEEEVK